LAFAVLAVVAWVAVESRMVEPLVDMTMLRDRPVWATNLSATLIGFGMFASFVLIPQFVEMPKSTGYGFGASVTEAGIFLLPATVGMLLAGPVAGRMSVTVGSRVPLALGGQIRASSRTASGVAGALPTPGAFVDAFWLSAAMLLLGFAAALLVPKRGAAPSAVAAEPGQVLDAV